MTWIDWVIAAIVLFAALGGLRRGTVAALLSAIGVVAAYLAASAWYRPVGALLTQSLRLPESWAFTSAFVILLLVAYEAIGIVVTMLVDSNQLSAASRLLGIAAGAMKGALLAMALLAVALASPLGEPVERDVPRSTLAPYAVRAHRTGVDALTAILPERMRPIGSEGFHF